MEPILKNPLFPSILRTWKFFTTFHDYLHLPQTFSQVSLYEFYQHIAHKSITSFTSQLIEALTAKLQGSQKNKKQFITALYLAKQNKYKFFEELTKISAYELGLTEVNLAFVWRDIEAISIDKPFEQLSEKQKFTYLSMLTDLVSTRDSFKKTYMETLKAEYATALQTDKQHTLEIQKKFIPKIHYSLILGKDSQDNTYFYLSKIGDSILKLQPKNKIWKLIEGQQNIMKEILQKILENQAYIKNEQVDLLEQIGDIWNRISWKMNYTAFDRHNKLFSLKEETPKHDKMKTISKMLHELDLQYTKFISDCYNFRWATKQKRVAYHKEINEAKTMQDLVGCFSIFFNQTKHAAQRKINTLEFYDTNLETQDQKPEQFKSIFLHANYLYNKGVVSETPNAEKYPIGLYYHIKSFLEDSVKYKHLHFEYLFIFVQSILRIIADLYPSHYQKRIKHIQQLEKQTKSKKMQQEKQKKGKQSKLRKNNKNVSSGSNSDDDSEGSSESETAEQKLKPQQGRRLREKVKINYKISNNSESHRITIKSKSSKQSVLRPRKQPGRNVKVYKKAKMILDSDSEDEVSLSVSDDESERSEKSGGLNLDNYKYEQTSPKLTLRRSVRNSSKSKEKK